MNLYFFAPWIILAFMIAVVLTTLMVVHFLITLCFIDDDQSNQQKHHQQSVDDVKYVNKHLTGYTKRSAKPTTPTGDQHKSGSYLKLPVAPWIKWGRKSKEANEMKSYVRSSSYCDISVTSASYQPYLSSWVLSEPQMYQQSVYHHDLMDSPSLVNDYHHNTSDHHSPSYLHSSYDSLTTSATTDTEFYRDWNHSIEFTDFSEFYHNVDPKYKDRNQNVIYI